MRALFFARWMDWRQCFRNTGWFGESDGDTLETVSCYYHAPRGPDHLVAMERDLQRIRARRDERHAAGLPDGHEASAVVTLSDFVQSELHPTGGDARWRDLLNPSTHALALRATKVGLSATA